MAWRIADNVVRGEIDNRERGRVTGRIWLEGLDEPLKLELAGNPWRDLAGLSLRFTNPKPVELGDLRPATEQRGRVGDITAARKVRVLDIPDDEFETHYRLRLPMPSHWENSLYLEWYSERNGRVVIEGIGYRLDVDTEPAWTMSEAEEQEQAKENAAAIGSFMEAVLEAVDDPVPSTEPADDDPGEPRSEVERRADDEAARMNLLLDRVDARLKREGLDEADFDRIYGEERERLRIERGEPEPEPPTPEQEAERQAWIEEFNTAAAEVENSPEQPARIESHPLVEACHDLGIELHRRISDEGLIGDGDSYEHPLCELRDGVTFASAKLAGALNRLSDEDVEWPPDPLFAGDTLVRLKKAYERLTDAIAGAEAAEEQRLADVPWLASVRRRVERIRESVRALIDEVRDSLD